MSKEIADLLKAIRQWMIDNDYECGKQGSYLCDRIEEVLYNNGFDNYTQK